MNNIVDQLNEVTTFFNELQIKAQYDDFSDISTEQASEYVSSAYAVINRASGSERTYLDRAKKIVEDYTGDYLPLAIPRLEGIIKSLSSAINKGYLISYKNLVKADTFSNFLEMAEYLLEEGYKDPAAVLIGGVLEENLRLLCEINGISIETRKGDLIKLKNANMMNQELGKAEVYNKLDQKNVTAWQDLRNKAAHGNYDQYTEDQVKNMLLSVREFLSRNMS